MQSDPSLKVGDQQLRYDFKMFNQNMGANNMTDSQLERKIKPREYAGNVLTNCGHIRKKESNVNDTKRGEDFYRKLPTL